MESPRSSSKSSRQAHRPSHTNSPSDEVERILGRYQEPSECGIIHGRDPSRKNAPPGDLDSQVISRIDIIMGLGEIEQLDEEKRLLDIRNRLESERLEEEQKAKSDERLKAMQKIYTDYGRYIIGGQYQSAMRCFDSNRALVIEGYVLLCTHEVLCDYINKLTISVCNKKSFRLLPERYREHLFTDTLIPILRKRPDVVASCQANIVRIAEFFPAWKHFILDATNNNRIPNENTTHDTALLQAVFA